MNRSVPRYESFLATDTHRFGPANLRKSAEPLELFSVAQTNCAFGPYVLVVQRRTVKF